MSKALALSALIGVGLADMACEPPNRPLIANLMSPQHAYTVQLSGRTTRPTPPLEHSVRAKIFKGSTVLVPSEVIHEGDWFDDSYEMRFTGTDWVYDNVLRFKAANCRSSDSSDEVIVANHSPHRIGFLKLAAQDVFLILDLEPSTTVTLAAQHTCGDFGGLSLEGAWADGRPIPWKFADFKLSGGAPRYEVTLLSEGIDFRETRYQSPIYVEPRRAVSRTEVTVAWIISGLAGAAIGMGWGWVSSRMFNRPAVQDISAALVGWILGGATGFAVELAKFMLDLPENSWGSVSASPMNILLSWLVLLNVLVLGSSWTRRRVVHATIVPVVLGGIAACIAAVWLQSLAT
ncbi:MAG TPA: hypothetical protein VJN96_17915 [Vicinamibacterales bacterium]|nr:hypothetical protein [Vicinamibacterales bacterium]